MAIAGPFATLEAVITPLLALNFGWGAQQASLVFAGGALATIVTLAIAPQLTRCDDLAGCRDLCRDAPRELSLDNFRQATLRCPLESALLRPLRPWIDQAPAVAPMMEMS